MYNISIQHDIDWGRVFGRGFLALMCISLAVCFGLAAALLDYYLVLALILIPATALLAILNTELALLIAVTAIIGIIPSSMQPAFSIAGVEIRTGEILLLILVALTFIKTLYRPTPILEMLAPLKSPLILLGILYIISVVYSVGFKRDAFGLAETRNLVGWVALPVAIYAFTWHFQRMDRYLHLFAALVAVLLVAQTITGVRLIYSERGAELISREFSEVIRGSAGAANFLLGYTFYYSLGRAANAERKIFWVLLANLMVLGLVVTFTRGAWLAVFVGVFMFFLITQVYRRILGILVLSGLFAVILAGGLLVAKPSLIGAVKERILSIEEEGARGSSVGFRFDENQQALKAIARNPVLGVGIGGKYKEYSGTSGRAVREGEFTYIHNSYLGLAIKLGVLGILAPCWIYHNLWREWKCHKPESYARVTGYRLNIAAAFSAITMFMVNGLSQPEWLRIGGLVVLSIIVAIILVASSHLDNESGSREGLPSE